VGFCFSLARNTHRLTDRFLNREIRDFKFDVFVADHADRSFLEEHFLSWPGIRSVRFVTREEALGRAHDDPALVQSIKLAVRNPLPESFEVVWDPSFLTPALLVPAAEKWSTLEGVKRVGYDLSRLERMALLSRLTQEMEVFFSVLLWGTLAAAVVGVGGLLFTLSVPLRLGPSLSGFAMGAFGGGVGALATFVWMGALEPAGIFAGALVGLLGGLIRGRDKG
jgi:cell division protein FtsX